MLINDDIVSANTLEVSKSEYEVVCLASQVYSKMESLETVKVDVVIDRTPNVVSCSSNFTAEELCILLCNKYGISPLTRTLFALRIKDTEYYLKDNSKVLSSTREYELRIRFKVIVFFITYPSHLKSFYLPPLTSVVT